MAAPPQGDMAVDADSDNEEIVLSRVFINNDSKDYFKLPLETLSINQNVQTDSDLVFLLIKLPQELLAEISKHLTDVSRVSLAMSCKLLASRLLSLPVPIVRPEPLVTPVWCRDLSFVSVTLAEAASTGLRDYEFLLIAEDNRIIEDLWKVHRPLGQHDRELGHLLWNIKSDGFGLCRYCRSLRPLAEEYWYADGPWWDKWQATMTGEKLLAVGYIRIAVENWIIAQLLCPPCFIVKSEYEEMIEEEEAEVDREVLFEYRLRYLSAELSPGVEVEYPKWPLGRPHQPTTIDRVIHIDAPENDDDPSTDEVDRAGSEEVEALLAEDTDPLGQAYGKPFNPDDSVGSMDDEDPRLDLALPNPRLVASCKSADGDSDDILSEDDSPSDPDVHMFG